jgi:hypothetical protein
MVFRGHRDGLEQNRSGNVLDLVKFTTKFESVLRKHLQRIEDNSAHNHYLGRKTFKMS